VLASIVDSDHPPAPSLFGENTLSVINQYLDWESSAMGKAVLFATYDENGGFFDHVAPVTAPRNTRRIHYCACGSRTYRGGVLPYLAPSDWVFVYRCSCFLRSAGGGLVSSGLFDHTSVLRFLETRFGAECPI